MEHSESIAQIAAALIAAQGEMGSVRKTADNPFFKSKYADLAGAVEASRPVLAQHNLGVVQSADCDGDLAVVETMLVHASGEWFKSRTVLKPVKSDPQGMGSAVTYARRYSYMAIIGLAAEDDDGNAASRQGAKAPQAIERPAARQGNGVQMDAKRKAYFAQAAKLGVEGDAAKGAVKEMFHLEHFSDATVEQLREAYAAMKERTAA
jgi:hypothetical protein